MCASVNVSVDLTQPENARETLYEMWGVANRISPKTGVAVRPGMKVNTVRMIGGIVKQDENGNRVPDLDFDTCTFDEATQSYVYNFAPLVERIDAILRGGTEIHQIVLDQPPWCFQRGYTFIPEGQQDGVNFREDERISIYGNSLPPDNKQAYFDYLAALMQRLVEVYGRETVLSWRFRIGSEIETPEHWYGTEQDFVEHFANSMAAIRSVLPDATVGLHTRPPDFVYKSGTIKNYKGETIKSFADALIEYSYENNIRYDFWGISDYPFITNEATRDPKDKFDLMFADLVNHPKWRAGTVIDVEEFSVITRISGELISSETAQADTFFVAMSDLFYQKGVAQVFQWGQRQSSDENWRTRALTDMVGKVRYQSEISGDTPGETDHIGAIVAKSPLDETIDILLYHYDPADILAEDTKTIRVEVASELPVGTSFFYRATLAGREQHAFTQFLKNEPPSGWIKNGYSRYGSPSQVLNEAGLAAWDAFENPNPRTSTAWQRLETIARSDGDLGSLIQLETQLPLFAFEKIEVKWSHETPGSLLVAWDQWTSSPVPATVSNGLAGIASAAEGSWAPQFRGGSADGTFGSLNATIAAADSTVGSSSDFHYTGYRSGGSGTRSLDFVLTENAGTGVNLGQFHFDIVSRGGSGAETWTLEVLEGGALTPGTLASGTIEASFDTNYLSNIDVPLGERVDSRLDAGESATFRLTLSTPDNRSVDIDNVGITKTGTIKNSLDTDNNGLPDAWEREHFGAIGQQADVDSDGDGYSNLEEFTLGTKPSDGSSSLRVEIEESNGSLTIKWESVAGRGYYLYWSANAAPDSWTRLTDDLIFSTGEPLAVQHTPTNEQPIFFKVQVNYPIIRATSSHRQQVLER